VAQLRVIVSPLVVWIWLGGAIAIGGALLALWPAPSRARRRVPSPVAGRLTHEPAS
jgi:cytochrome c-type biogenesis protein CcmF